MKHEQNYTALMFFVFVRNNLTKAHTQTHTHIYIK